MFPSSALSPVHPAAVPAALAGDPLRRKDNEKRSVLQVSLQISFVELGIVPNYRPPDIIDLKALKKCI